MLGLLGDDAVLALPSAGPAPLRTAGPDELQAARLAAGRFSSLAGLTGAPAVSLPAPAVGAPIGLSLVVRPGADASLLDVAAGWSSRERGSNQR